MKCKYEGCIESSTLAEEVGKDRDQRGEYWINLYCLWPEEPPRGLDVFFGGENIVKSLVDVVFGAGLMFRHDLAVPSPEG